MLKKLSIKLLGLCIRQFLPSFRGLTAESRRNSKLEILDSAVKPRNDVVLEKLSCTKLVGVVFAALLVASCARRPFLQTTFPSGAKYPQKVTLLLPFQGRYGASGRAIRDGFLAAYYYVSAHSQDKIQLSLLDTSKGNTAILYQKAVNEGAEFIVGPLTKQSVMEIYELKPLTVPILALNTLPNYQEINTPNLVQFGLFAQDEALQMAQKAWSEHPGRTLIIVPQGTWGQNMATVMQQYWRQQNGQVVETVSYKSKNLGSQLAKALNITASRSNASALRLLLREKFKFIPRRRQDIDTILLVAFPKDARQIRPLLKFYFAGDIPVYATSHIFAGIVNPQKDRDLNGINFCDMPWVLQSDNDLPQILPILRQQIRSLWPNSYRAYSRLYALGIDSFYLMLNLAELVAHPNSGIDGASGMFYLDQYGHIYRQLLWAKMVEGEPVLD